MLGGGPAAPHLTPPCLLVRTLGWELLPPAACGNKTTGGLGLPAWCGAAGGNSGPRHPQLTAGLGGLHLSPITAPPHTHSSVLGPGGWGVRTASSGFK